MCPGSFFSQGASDTRLSSGESVIAADMPGRVLVEAADLRADARVTHGRVAEVMAILRNAGFRSIGIVTDQAPQDGQGQ